MQGARPIIQVFDGQHRELIIPVYQRNYDWQRKHCAQLFDDLEEIIREGREAHFFGAIVGGGTSFEWLVIDGQQRLTTVSILMRTHPQRLPHHRGLNRVGQGAGR